MSPDLEQPASIPIERSAPPIDALPPPTRWRRSRARAPWLTVVLGAWLLASIYMWPHSIASVTNTGLVGILTIAIALVSLYVAWTRWMNVVLGAWLTASTLVIEHAVIPTMWNNVLVGLLVILASLASPMVHRR